MNDFLEIPTTARKPRVDGVRSEDVPRYADNVSAQDQKENAILAEAARILARRMTEGSKRPPLNSPTDTRHYFQCAIGTREYECFCVAYLDNRHRVIAFEEVFRGTIDGTAVYPREIVKRALHHNAAAVIFAHNHPSGVAEPSRADEMLTVRLKDALAMVKIRTLDHLVIGDTVVSFAERGMI